MWFTVVGALGLVATALAQETQNFFFFWPETSRQCEVSPFNGSRKVWQG